MYSLSNKPYRACVGEFNKSADKGSDFILFSYNVSNIFLKHVGNEEETT